MGNRRKTCQDASDRFAKKAKKAAKKAAKASSPEKREAHIERQQYCEQWAAKWGQMALEAPAHEAAVNQYMREKERSTRHMRNSDWR